MVVEKNDILFQKEDGVATITLNRPERNNAFNLGMIDLWVRTMEAWAKDDEIKVIVLTGTSDSFCSGADFAPKKEDPKEVPPDDLPYRHKMVLWEKIQRIPLLLEDIDKPVIAAVNGVAVGAGMDMALMCDIRFAAETARFSEAYIKVGMVPGTGGTYYLPRIVGMAKALELLWLGDFIDVQEAYRIGLVNKVLPKEDLMKETYLFAKRLAKGPDAVIRTIKRAAYQSSRCDLRTALDLISSHQGVVRSTKASKEAFILWRERYNKADW
jgi:2-(1,2-epoxy-1,2-dihydrophenyl)acetyl-CoA isomerase